MTWAPCPHGVRTRGKKDILAITTTREGATNLRNYFSIAGKKADAETAVKVAGATAKHCIVIHGVSTFLSGEGRNLDYDQECFTRANVAYSRATDLTILACPVNMQGMPGALQVLAALLHGVQTIYTCDSNKEPDILGSLDLRATQVAQATTFFQQALLPHPMWLGPPPVCLAEHHHGKVRRLRLVLAALTHLTKAEITSLLEGPYLPGGTVLHNLVYGYAADSSLEPEWLVITDGQQPGRWRLLHNGSGPGQRCSVGSFLRHQPTPSTREQRSAQDYKALHRVYFCDAWRVQPVLDAPESDLVLPPKPGLLEHGCYWPRPNLTPEVLSISDRDPEKEEQEVQEGQSPTSLAVTDAAMAEEDANEAVSITAPPPSRPLSRAQSNRRMMTRAWQMMLVLAPPLQKKRVIALAIVRPFLMHVPRKMKCWRQKMMQGASYLHRTWTPQAVPNQTKTGVQGQCPASSVQEVTEITCSTIQATTRQHS